MGDRAGHVLVDAGDGRRLERFGDRLVDRPAPAALGPRRAADAWPGADARFERAAQGGGGGWLVNGPIDPWSVEIGALRLELRYASGGQVGLFPEHLGFAGWLVQRVQALELDGDDRPRILNLFAYTGALTLVAARAGAEVAHVDASRPAVAWGRRNAVLSGLADRPIRWLVDDAERFVRREASRGRRYDGIIVDPPTYGHGGGRTWRLESRLDPLLAAVAGLVGGAAPFVLLTAHARDLGPDELARRLAAAVGVRPANVDAGCLDLTADSGARLPLGAFARWSR